MALKQQGATDHRRRLWTEVISSMGPTLGLRVIIQPILLLSLVFSNSSVRSKQGLVHGLEDFSYLNQGYPGL